MKQKYTSRAAIRRKISLRSVGQSVGQSAGQSVGRRRWNDDTAVVATVPSVVTNTLDIILSTVHDGHFGKFCALCPQETLENVQFAVHSGRRVQRQSLGTCYRRRRARRIVGTRTWTPRLHRQSWARTKKVLSLQENEFDYCQTGPAVLDDDSLATTWLLVSALALTRRRTLSVVVVVVVCLGRFVVVVVELTAMFCYKTIAIIITIITSIITVSAQVRYHRRPQSNVMLTYPKM